MGVWFPVVLVLVAAPARDLSAQRVWPTDLLVQSMDIALLNANLVARVVLLSEYDEARAMRVETLVPVGVGILRMAPGCTASAAPQGVSALRARVTCQLGNLPMRTSREVFVMTTIPPTGGRRSFGAFAMCDTPDPSPVNNFAERTLP
jgi:hypothetical protein